jgi:hypothetical protein
MSGMSYAQHWFDDRTASVLGTGAALPGEPVTTEEILSRLHLRFGVDVRRQGRSIAARLGVNTATSAETLPRGTRHLEREIRTQS